MVLRRSCLFLDGTAWLGGIMKIGDLVRLAQPWSYSTKTVHLYHLVGVILETANPKANGKMAMLRVHWFLRKEFDGWFGEHKLEAVKKCP